MPGDQKRYQNPPPEHSWTLDLLALSVPRGRIYGAGHSGLLAV